MKKVEPMVIELPEIFAGMEIAAIRDEEGFWLHVQDEEGLAEPGEIEISENLFNAFLLEFKDAPEYLDEGALGETGEDLDG